MVVFLLHTLQSSQRAYIGTYFLSWYLGTQYGANKEGLFYHSLGFRVSVDYLINKSIICYSCKCINNDSRPRRPSIIRDEM